LAAGRDVGIPELKRLEASLRWLQREEAATRIPRAVQLPPVPGLALAEVSGRRLAGETLDFPPRSLDPGRMPPPPATRSRRHRLFASLIILIAGVVAVPIGYYFWTAGRTPSSHPAVAPQVASLAQKTDASLASIGQQELPRTVDRGDSKTLPPTETPSQAAETPQPQPRPPSAAETVARLQPSATGDQAPPASKAIRVLGPEEIKLLMKQGEQLIAAGDLAAARTVLQRAAEAGDADAAIMLGATFDPNVLAKLGVMGVSADVEKARHWYQEAESLGSPDARRRLDTLANR